MARRMENGLPGYRLEIGRQRLMKGLANFNLLFKITHCQICFAGDVNDFPN